MSMLKASELATIPTVPFVDEDILIPHEPCTEFPINRVVPWRDTGIRAECPGVQVLGIGPTCVILAVNAVPPMSAFEGIGGTYSRQKKGGGEIEKTRTTATTAGSNQGAPLVIVRRSSDQVGMPESVSPDWSLSCRVWAYVTANNAHTEPQSSSGHRDYTDRLYAHLQAGQAGREKLVAASVAVADKIAGTSQADLAELLAAFAAGRVTIRK